MMLVSRTSARANQEGFWMWYQWEQAYQPPMALTI